MPFVQTMPSVIKGVDRLNAGPIRKKHATGIKTPPRTRWRWRGAWFCWPGVCYSVGLGDGDQLGAVGHLITRAEKDFS